MTNRMDQLKDDRAIRDTARGLFQANIEHLRGLIEVNANRDRLAQRATDEIRELTNDAGQAAAKNKGAIAFIAAAIVLWFSRDGIASLINRSDNSGDNPLTEFEPDTGLETRTAIENDTPEIVAEEVL